MNYKLVFITMVMVLLSTSLYAQTFTDSKTYRKSFRAGSDAIIEVTNKYGDIHISHTNGDSITVTVEVTASSNTGEKLDAMIADVEISLAMTNNIVRAQTSFAKGITPLSQRVRGLTKNLISFDSRLKIDYFIECPPQTVLRVTNSYGDVYIGDETPELTLVLSNGTLDAAAVRNTPQMELTFCKANVKSIDQGKLTLSFSELRVKETGKIILASVSSKVWMERSQTLDLDSKRDDINIGSAGVITGASYFSDIIADNLTGEINMTAKYGNLSFGNIDPGFSLIDLRASYTDIDLAVAERAGYTLEIRHTNAFVSLPGVEPEPERTEISAQNKTFLTRALVGGGSDRSEIRIDATRGEVRLLQK